MSISNDLEYIQLKSNIDNIKQLRKTLIICMTNLKESHKVMVEEINKKNSTIDSINELKDLTKSIVEINQIVKELK